MSIKRPFFLSALCFAVAFVLGTLVNMLWPIPTDVILPGGSTANLMSQAAWILGIIGLIAFVVGIWNKAID